MREITIERMTRNTHANLEIQKFIDTTKMNSNGHYYFLTLTQDRSIATESEHKLMEKFDNFIKYTNNRTCNKKGSFRSRLSFITFTEDADRISINKHIHCVIYVPNILSKEFDRIFISGTPSKAERRWRGEHPKGTYDIRHLKTDEDVENVLNYSTKTWSRYVELSDCGRSPYFRVQLGPRRGPANELRPEFAVGTRNDDVSSLHS